jgi:signal transduction histidine kinase
MTVKFLFMPASWNKIFVALLICAVSQMTVSGQKTDSLINVLKTTSQDTSKVAIMIKIATAYSQAANMVEAKEWVDNAMALAEKTKKSSSIRMANVALGNYYHRNGNIFHGQSNFPEALNNYLSALRIFEKIDDTMRMGLLIGNIGLLYWSQRNFSEALKYHNQALKLFQDLKDKHHIAGTLNNIGLVYENKGDYDEALKYYFATLKIYDELGDKMSMVGRYFNIGFLYEDQKKFEEAAKNHLAAMKLSEELKNRGLVGAANNNLGEVYFHQALSIKDPDKRISLLNAAYDCQLKALSINKELGDSDDYVAYNDLAAICFEFKKFAESKNYMDTSLAIIMRLKDVEATKEVYEQKWKLDSAAGNWEEAFRDHQLYIFYRDSIFNQESTRKMMRAQMQYDFDKKEDSLKYQQSLTDERLKQQTLLNQQQEQKLLLQEKELQLSNNVKEIQELQIKNAQADFAVQKANTNKKQNELLILNQEKNLQAWQLKKQKQVKNYLIAGLGLLIILSFFIYKNYRTRNQLRLQTLRNKIASDLHDDVGSTLSSISIFSQMAQQKSKDVIPMLETIGESSRRMLDAMADIVWTINPENDQFEKIILRMKSFAYELLGASKIDFEFLAGEEVSNINVPMEVRKNLYLIFKEATNNMVKYAQANKAMFTIKEEKNILRMMIRDDGKGFDMNKATQGNGLKNMMRRASEIGGELHIESFPGNGTTIQLDVAV